MEMSRTVHIELPDHTISIVVTVITDTGEQLNIATRCYGTEELKEIEVYENDWK